MAPAIAAAPVIAVLEPTPSSRECIRKWDPRLKAHEQTHPDIPQTFRDAMEVRQKIFVEEQGVEQCNEFDWDDARSVHIVIYAKGLEVVKREVLDPETGAAVIMNHSETCSRQPIGTIRIVPPPHPPHPRKGEAYIGGDLISGEELKTKDSADNDSVNVDLTGDDGDHVNDRDKKVYAKFGRLAVLKEFRGRGIAGKLVRAAVDWTIENSEYCLVCVHAQDQPHVVRMWEHFRFKRDEAMGRWEEEGIPHVGMFMYPGLWYE
ncbi:acyl-CoA N-acyltransferase [Apodospora peruviana]|uniref:Acyl-CoA N-acyltransferase n=1 Tax=Apodospora peruviana TaxID=516989 RepID=A0AAE0M1B5_9PEZI|nr:acyl-CoA N-acyltransferase [Apodospora peruviana]